LLAMRSATIAAKAAPTINARMLAFIRKKTLIVTLLIAATLAVSSCSTLPYYFQAVNGQMEILNKRQPIDALVRDPATPQTLRTRLSALVEIREFASRELALPNNGSYRTYADLRRPFVIWNVVATPEFSIHPRQWCFPLAGCVTYRGYFSKQEAQTFAAGLRGGSDDVYVGGVPAYSTLGWFNDPVLNTFINYPEVELARLVFHELAHQVAYAPGDSMFNESFATAVEEEGVGLWLERSRSAALREQWERAQGRRSAFQTLVLKYRDKLEALYASGIVPDSMRPAKQRVFQELKQEYEQLKQGWGGYKGYDRWFGQDLNNAHLASIAVYTELVPSFHALFARDGRDFPAFYRAVKGLAKLPQDERGAQLRALAGDARLMRIAN
jgi:predicted aminopeptidase